MKRRIALIVSFLVLSVAAPVSASTKITPLVWSRASTVARCEEGGWHNVHGPTYFGSLGWLQATWDDFKLPSMPSRMDLATPAEQAWALWQFAKKYGWPDIHGCRGY